MIKGTHRLQGPLSGPWSMWTNLVAIENRRSDGKGPHSIYGCEDIDLASRMGATQMRGCSYQILFMHPRVRLLTSQRFVLYICISLNPRIELCSTLKSARWNKMVAALMNVFIHSDSHLFGLYQLFSLHFCYFFYFWVTNAARVHHLRWALYSWCLALRQNLPKYEHIFSKPALCLYPLCFQVLKSHFLHRDMRGWTS